MTKDDDDDELFKDIPQARELSEAVKSGDRRKALLGIRDFLVHELEGHRCNKCQMSVLRTGDTASLVLRLIKVIEDLDKIPKEDGEKSALAKIRERAGLHLVPDPPAPAVDKIPHGTKKAPRRQGGRAPKGTRKAGGS